MSLVGGTGELRALVIAALLQHHHCDAALRQLPGRHGPAGAGADHHHVAFEGLPCRVGAGVHARLHPAPRRLGRGQPRRAAAGPCVDGRIVEVGDLDHREQVAHGLPEQVATAAQPFEQRHARLHVERAERTPMAQERGSLDDEQQGAISRGQRAPVVAQVLLNALDRLGANRRHQAVPRWNHRLGQRAHDAPLALAQHRVLIAPPAPIERTGRHVRRRIEGQATTRRLQQRWATSGIPTCQIRLCRVTPCRAAQRLPWETPAASFLTNPALLRSPPWAPPERTPPRFTHATRKIDQGVTAGPVPSAA